MKKMKFSLMSLAVIVAITSAFTTRPDVLCDNATQYYKVNGVYLEAGEEGVDYDCDYTPAVTCTYYKPNPVTHPNSYSACKLGDFILLGTTRAKE
jgi:hypothetical protein